MTAFRKAIYAIGKTTKESWVWLLTTSGHFVEGDDPESFGFKNMDSDDVQARI